MFMVVKNRLGHDVQLRGGLGDTVALAYMGTHDLLLGQGQLSGTVQNFLRDAHLADVMEQTEQGQLIPLMIANALADKNLPVYGTGENVRDWLYVKDHCYGILAVLEKGKVGEVYNLGGHNEKANIEIVKIILEKLGKPDSLITHVADRHGHDQRYAINPAKAMRELGWAPTTMFKDGIVLTIDWYMSEEGRKWTEECTSGEYLKWIEKNYKERT